MSAWFKLPHLRGRVVSNLHWLSKIKGRGEEPLHPLEALG